MRKHTYNLSEIPGFNDLLKPNVVCNSSILKLNKVVCKSSNNQYLNLIKFNVELIIRFIVLLDMIRTFYVLI